jgi:hypothetical protein
LRNFGIEERGLRNDAITKMAKPFVPQVVYYGSV